MEYTSKKLAWKLENAKTNGKKAALTKQGIIKEKAGKENSFISLKNLIKITEINVANVPSIISKKPKGLAKFAKKQPMLSPGIAAGVNKAKTIKASENLSWITPKDNPKTKQI